MGAKLDINILKYKKLTQIFFQNTNK